MGNVIEYQEEELYPIEISEVLAAGETIYNRSKRGRAYFYLILDTSQET
ncbi:MAG: hypothetical protein FWF08_00580 [Oscillospiraceae bacterium]|nr:hypothetical protein [Oscillospiraceae bacterium]